MEGEEGSDITPQQKIQAWYKAASKEAQEGKEEAIQLLKKIILSTEGGLEDEEISTIKTAAIQDLGALYAKLGRGKELRDLVKELRPFFATTPKARTAKLVRTLIDRLSTIPNQEHLLLDMLKESIEWTKVEKRTYLRQRLETKLSATLFKTKEYTEALDIIQRLLPEVKKLDDKPLLVEIFLLESRIHHALRHIPKSKAALTAARTHASAIYCPPALQAHIDAQSGTLHAEERDYKTGYSYFYEAFEGYTTINDPKALQCLKYMLLCKIMTKEGDEVNALMHGKLALQINQEGLEAMRAIADAYKERSIKKFKIVKEKYEEELSQDAIIHRHLSDLYENLLEQNLNRIVEPFSRVEISHVAKLIELPVETVEKKLSQMILDDVLSGTLDQGKDCLIVSEKIAEDELYVSAISTIEKMGLVVSSLGKKAKSKLH